MPVVSNDVLAELIRTAEILLLSVDTSVFDQKQHSYHNEPLRSLTQFSDSRYGLIISSTVKFEVIAHLQAKISQSLSNFRNATKELLGPLNLQDRRADEIVKSVFGEVDPPEFARNQVEKFFADCGALIIDDATVTPMSELLSRYFNSTPPFSTKKKSEFPDAVALLGIESHAKTNRSKCVVVSTDQDWKSFCEHSDLLYYNDSLLDVLSWLARPDTGFIKFWDAHSTNQESLAVREEILSAAEDAILDMDVDVDVSPNYNGRIEAEIWATEILDLNFTPDTTARVIDQRDSSNRFVASFKVSAEVQWSMTLSHLIWDSEDGEELPISSDEESYQERVSFSISAVIEKSEESFHIVEFDTPVLYQKIYLGYRDFL